MPKRLSIIALATAAFLLPGSAALADHVPTTNPSFGLTADTPELKVGPVRWVSNVQAGRGVAAPFGEGAPFERDGRKYFAVSSTAPGLQVVDVTSPLKPVVVSAYVSAAGCPTAPTEEAAAHQRELAGLNNGTFGVLFNMLLGVAGGWENDQAVTPDGKIAILGMDAYGRCHDPSAGGLEFIDLSDLKNPRTLHLTRNVGDSHSVTIDPAHPWLAYVSTSDGSDFIDVVDFKSCLGGVASIARCQPVIARVNFDTKTFPEIVDPKDPKSDVLGTGCHDMRFLRMRAYCAAVDTTMIFDTSKVIGANGELSGTHLTSGPKACPVVDAQRAPGVKVTDCYAWTEKQWAETGARSAGLGLVSFIIHDGSKPANQDIEISHQAEPIEDGKVLLITDERGGGLGFGPRFACPGGGFWLYDIRDESHPKLMTNPEGGPAVFMTQNFVQTYVSCTVHYGEQFEDENLLAFAWYTGGTHLIRYDINYAKSPAVVKFTEVGAYIPAGAMTIQAKGLARNPENPDELLVITADDNRGIDIIAFNAPKLAASGGGVPTKVLGVRFRGGVLPATGAGDATLPGLALLAIAIFIARRVRAAR